MWPRVATRPDCINIWLSASLRHCTNGESTKVIENPGHALTVEEVIDLLEADWPGIKALLLDDEGHIRRFTSIHAGDHDCRFLHGSGTLVEPGQSLSLIVAYSGG